MEEAEAGRWAESSCRGSWFFAECDLFESLKEGSDLICRVRGTQLGLPTCRVGQYSTLVVCTFG